MIDRYRSKLSGPLIDRIDLVIEMPEVSYEDLASKPAGESSAQIRRRVNDARARQRKRFADEKIMTNPEMNAAQIRRYCTPEGESAVLMRQAFQRLHLSARAYNRILKVARTIADLEGSVGIGYAHYAEAIQYRTALSGGETD